MPKMLAAQVVSQKGSLELVEIDIPNPGPNQVRVKVYACGICHSDSFTKDGAFPGIQYPRVPGHEIAGVIDQLGEGVTQWKVGQRVGIGWFGGNCGKCESCRRGDFITCQQMQIPGISYNGGYAEYTVVPVSALALIPDELSYVEAAPLMCAGITTFNSLRNSGATAGDIVAVLGIGGLGHLAVQYANKMGFNTVAIARGADKAPLAKQLGAKHYIDSEKENVAATLMKLGGAKVILSTVTSGKAINGLVNGLAIDGKLMLLGGVLESIDVQIGSLVRQRRSIMGWPSGTSIASQDTMSFSAQTGIRSMNEVFSLKDAAKAYDHMLSGKARFRVVLSMEK